MRDEDVLVDRRGRWDLVERELEKSSGAAMYPHVCQEGRHICRSGVQQAGEARGRDGYC